MPPAAGTWYRAFVDPSGGSAEVMRTGPVKITAK